MTHDYVRHGATTLFAALDLASGQMLTRCQPRHCHQEFLRFLQEIDAKVPQNLDIHLVVDPYATHKHATVKQWVGSPAALSRALHPHLFLLAHQVEIWFNIITQRAIHRGTFRRVKDIVTKIQTFVAHYNSKSKPFMWTAATASIITKLHRFLKGMAGTRH